LQESGSSLALIASRLMRHSLPSCMAGIAPDRHKRERWSGVICSRIAACVVLSISGTDAQFV
jgi:hypothetical protein